MSSRKLPIAGAAPRVSVTGAQQLSLRRRCFPHGASPRARRSSHRNTPGLLRLSTEALRQFASQLQLRLGGRARAEPPRPKADDTHLLPGDMAGMVLVQATCPISSACTVGNPLQPVLPLRPSLSESWRRRIPHGPRRSHHDPLFRARFHQNHQTLVAPSTRHRRPSDRRHRQAGALRLP